MLDSHMMVLDSHVMVLDSHVIVMGSHVMVLDTLEERKQTRLSSLISRGAVGKSRDHQGVCNAGRERAEASRFRVKFQGRECNLTQGRERERERSFFGIVEA